MTTTQLIILIAIGLLSGFLSGILGVGGAIIVIPALVFMLGLSQHEAQGTSLTFMLLPIGLLAAMNYWKEGYVNWKFALILAITFFVGGYFGSVLAIDISGKVLKKIFGILIMVVAIKMIFSK